MAYPPGAVECAMKAHEVIMRALDGQLTWIQAAEILGRSPRSIRRLRWLLQHRGYDGLFDRRRRTPSPKRAPVAEVRAVVARCPSGALRALPSEPENGSAAVTVRVSEDGPVLLRGRIRLERADGALLAELEAASLCRCGATANPPFCDGSHERLAGHRG